MTLVELVEVISRDLGIPKTKVRRVLSSFVDEVRETAMLGEPVKVKGLGRFEKRVIKARMMFGRMTRDRDTLSFRPYGERHGKVRSRD